MLVLLPPLLYLAFFVELSNAQPTPEDLGPLFDGLTTRVGGWDLSKRVPLSTNDDTISPLIDLQVFAPPVVPKGGSSCTVQLFNHTFGDGSYNAPVIVPYIPPIDKACGEIGNWAAISMNLSVNSIGTQYDRLGEIYLSHVEIWRTSSAEPTKTGTVWNTLKDVTHYARLFAQPGELMMDFSNIIDPNLLLDAAFDVILSVTFYAPTKDFPSARTSDKIVPLSNLSPTLPNFFAIDNDAGASTNITLPSNTIEAYVEVFCSGNAAEEFWYLNTPDEFVDRFPTSTGVIGKGPFREVQVLVDGQLAGVVWPYAVIYTGGITPSNWRPLTSYGAYDQPTYWVSITPFLPVLLSTNVSHTITLRVQGQGVNPSFNSNWFVSGSVHMRTGTGRTTGRMRTYDVPNLDIRTTGSASAGNKTVWTQVSASRQLIIESELETSEGRKVVSFTQDLKYTNDARYENDGWVQWATQTTVGITVAKQQGTQTLRDAFSYPITVFSNYSLYNQTFGTYGSDIMQNHTRALQPPVGVRRTIHSVQHAQGEVGMDNWPGLRHAINGSGATQQTFAYTDERGETYFRNVATKNDGWVRDNVWGSLRDANPPVPDNQIYGPGGGPGFRRMVWRRAIVN